MAKSTKNEAILVTPRTYTFNEKELEGISDLQIDDKVRIIIDTKVVRIGRDIWGKKKPLEVTVEHVSGIIDDTKAKIRKANNLKELEDIEEDIK